MKIISSNEIQSLNDKKSIEDKKHTKELNKAVNPPKMKIKTSRAPKSAPMSASRLKNILKYQSMESGGESAVRLPKSQYQEYKQSLKESTINVVTSLQPEYADTVRDKLLGSNDIVNILSEKVMNLDLIENEWLILGLTVAGKFLEANQGI